MAGTKTKESKSTVAKSAKSPKPGRKSPAIARGGKSPSREVDLEVDVPAPDSTEAKLAQPAESVNKQQEIITKSEIQDTSTSAQPVSIDNDASPQGSRQNKSPSHRDSNSQSSKSGKGTQSSPLSLNLSESLMVRLRQKAASEGVTLDEFASELLAEGLVLRAWEIMERKTTLRQPSQHGQRQGNAQRFSGGSFRNGQNGNFNGNRQRPQHGGGGHGNNRRNNFSQVMDDNASFLEYVRNQEKRKGL